MKNYEELINMIPEGCENAIPRYELRLKASITDRDMRQKIEDARADGVPVLNFGRGYFISHDPDDIRWFIQMNTARIASISRWLKPMKEMAAQIPGQANLLTDMDEVTR